jgi:Tfp pilus assembly protein PilN
LTKSQKKKQIKKFPHKRIINLYVKKRNKDRPIFFLTLLGLVLFIFAFTQIAVLGRLQNVRDAYAALEVQRAEFAVLEEALADYDRVIEEYNRYTDAYLPEDLTAIVDRGDVLKLVYNSAPASVFITNLSITGTTVTVGLTAPTLNVISDYERTIAAEVFVESAQTHNASTSVDESTGEETVSATLRITLLPQGTGGNANA